MGWVEGNRINCLIKFFKKGNHIGVSLPSNCDNMMNSYFGICCTCHPSDLVDLFILFPINAGSEN